MSQVERLAADRLRVAGHRVVTPDLFGGAVAGAHVADGDQFDPPDQPAAFRASALRTGAEASLHTYPGVGHFYSDPSLPDYDPIATDRTWQHVHALLEEVRDMPL